MLGLGKRYKRDTFVRGSYDKDKEVDRDCITLYIRVINFKISLYIHLIQRLD